MFKTDSDSATGVGRDKLPWRILLLWLIWALLVCAAARPQWTGEPVTLPTTGRDLMLAVDISGSMGTEDLQLGGQLVNRLVVVKNVVRDFIVARQGDRVGLILFGTNAYVQAPLTFDLPTVNQLLTEAPVGIAGGKTAIGDAIGLAVKRLRQRPAGDKVLVLLTDGANNVGEVAPIKAAELAGQEGIRIYTIGVGADEMRLPSIFGTFGSRVVNPSAELDEDTLNAIANTTGGQYYRAQNTAKLIEIYAIIDELEPIEQEAETYRPIAALYHWPMAGGLALFLMLLVADWRGWGGD
jgi:Ca-activated chloride channel family protein